MMNTIYQCVKLFFGLKRTLYLNKKSLKFRKKTQEKSEPSLKV